MNQQEAERLLLGEETLDDRLATLSQRSPAIRNLGVEIPAGEWRAAVGRELWIPDGLTPGFGAGSLTAADVERIEQAIEQHHGIACPFGAVLQISATTAPAAYLAQHDGQDWTF